MRGVLRRADLGKRVDDRVPRPQRPVEEQAGAFDGEPVPIEGICVLPTGRRWTGWARRNSLELNVIVDDVLATGKQNSAGAQDAPDFGQHEIEISRVVQDLPRVDDVDRP